MQRLIKLLAFFIFLAGLTYLGFVSCYRIHEGEFLILHYSSRTLKEIKVGEGFVFIPELIYPGFLQVERKIYKKRFLSFYYKRDLSQDTLPDFPASVKSFEWKGTMTYSISDSELESVYLNNGKTMEGIDEFIKEKIYRYFDSYFEALPAITNISALKLKLNTEKSGIQTREMPNFLLKFGIKTEALALKKEKFPPENLFKELMLSGDVTVKSLLEKKQAELKGDLYSLEQKKKDEVYFQFLEKMSAFLKQNPHMKDFVIMDRLGIKSGQIHINAGDWTVEKPQTTHSKNYSLKKLPKIIE